MIPDTKTNKLYLADCLPVKYPEFYKRFEKTLKEYRISYSLLPHTKDVWVVDYMPIQIDKDNFIQFVYNPDYLRKSIKWRKTISNVDAICNAINTFSYKSDIILDGGNIIKSADKVIMCDKVFSENPTISEKDLVVKLQNLFQISKLIFIPTHSKDFTGHADGMVRFYTDDTVLINNYSQESKEFQLRFRMALHNAGLQIIEIPYNPYINKNYTSAKGVYINFLQMNHFIVIPTFGIKEDEAVVKLFEQLFPHQDIASIESNILANDGGVLNCITWNILN